MMIGYSLLKSLPEINEFNYTAYKLFTARFIGLFIILAPVVYIINDLIRIIKKRWFSKGK
jgi:hypothetical protein